MTRLKVEDILKPGTVMRTEKIDPNDPEFKAIMKEHKKAIRESKRIHGWRFDQFGFRRIR